MPGIIRAARKKIAVAYLKRQRRRINQDRARISELNRQNLRRINILHKEKWPMRAPNPNPLIDALEREKGTKEEEKILRKKVAIRRKLLERINQTDQKIEKVKNQVKIRRLGSRVTAEEIRGPKRKA